MLQKGLGKRIAELRRNRGLTQVQLARDQDQLVLCEYALWFCRGKRLHAQFCQRHSAWKPWLMAIWACGRITAW